ncbi:peptide deformylase [Salinisphaera hydrothermalis]|uniref:Peptide deformylase n=1 Tax=Salinisphaera hydrothermalis (strain C41B8) TaxID=1304275 RepID=A0A084IKS9_SALHC|nr:peptide deformylase [Salinisphaera hydrothermalis]KEZ77313.1 peptide deformylase [Salinisphaera hydrothermalis C41B8]
MAIRKIARMGHPVLRQPTTPIADPTDGEIQRLIADMKETLADAEGVGLAAPQVYATWSVMMFFVPPSRAAEDANDDGVPLTVLVNPEIEPIGDERVGGWEGCLSIPGLQGYVPRWRRIRYRGLDERGAPIEREAADFHARVVQHEYDHLQGVLYPERMTDMTQFGFVEELMRHPAGAPDDV